MPTHPPTQWQAALDTINDPQVSLVHAVLAVAAELQLLNLQTWVNNGYRVSSAAVRELERHFSDDPPSDLPQPGAVGWGAPSPG